MDFLKILKPRKNKFSEELITQPVNLEVENTIDELPEDHQDVISFRVDYLGNLLVDKIPNFNADHALKLLKQKRETNKMKTQRGVILISPNNVKLTDMRAKQIFKIPILRISSCAMDPFNKNVFFFMSVFRNERTYYAFLCEKWKNAYNAAQAIAHMFGQSHEKYEREMQNKKFVEEVEDEDNKQNNGDKILSMDMMDFTEDLSQNSSKNEALTKNWVSFED